MDFIGRTSELETLNAELKCESGFVVIYGRRRVGKTTLIKEFIKNKRAFYFLATTESEFTIIFYHNISVMFIMLIIGLNDFISLKSNDLMFLIVGGLIGAIAQYCMIHAFKLSSSSGLASAGYIMIVPNVLFDIFLFHKIPDVYILFGTLLTLSGLYMAFRLQRKFK